MSDGKIITEEELGVEEMVDDLEKAFTISCRMNKVNVNGTSEQDIGYQRRYLFTLFSMMVKEMQEIRDKDD